MLQLENIRREGNCIIADYCYEDESDKGILVYYMDRGEACYVARNREDAEYESDCAIGKAKIIFPRLLKRESLPERYVYMWY